MTRSARDAKERGWIWMLRAVGLLLAVVVVGNLVELGTTFVVAMGDSPAPTTTTYEHDPYVVAPGAYHSECAEFRPTMAARVSHAVQQMLPATLIASEAELPNCQRCGDRIERGSQIWICLLNTSPSPRD